MAFRPEYREALSLLAQAIKVITDAGHEPPVLVGGAAVEFFTGGDIASGDFDLVTPHQSPLEEALERFGFERALEPGILVGGVIHRKLGFGVQVVSGLLMDGRTEQSRITVVEVVPGAPISIIPVEDLIADRVAQAFAVKPLREDMMDQAVKMLHLAEGIDDVYLDKRICEESGGDANLTLLKRYVT